MKKIKAGVIVFPGTNCEKDTFDALMECGFNPEYIYANETNLKPFDMIILPGGFSYGDYIHSGRIAKFSPVINSIKNFNGLKIGICNGFQILTEINLLPGALLLNKSSYFISKNQSLIFKNKKISLPVAHREGRFYAPDDILKKIKENNMIFLKYDTNPNGSIDNIAGLVDYKTKTLALMPHPERAVFKNLNNGCDGRLIFEFFKELI